MYNVFYNNQFRQAVIWKSHFTNSVGIRKAGFVVTIGARAIAFVKGVGRDSFRLARSIVSNPKRASHAMFDWRKCDGVPTGLKEEILYKMTKSGRISRADFAAAEYRFNGGFINFTRAGLEHRLIEGPIRFEVPMLGFGYAGDGFARVKPGKEIETEGMTFGRDADSFDQVPAAPSAA